MLLLATRNQGKVAEIQAALAGLGLRFKTLADLPAYVEPPEDGQTFAENAQIKAVAACKAGGLPALADDSGLEVDALDGAPGVYSARFGGPGLSDAERNARLLALLEGVPQERRTARFRAVLALQLPQATSPRFWEGTIEGWIGFEPRGEGGFGYDPIFYLRDDQGNFLEQSLAELTRAQKNAISHRGKALNQLRAAIQSGELVL